MMRDLLTTTVGSWNFLLDQAIDRRAAQIRDIRRHLHAHPEPSGEEYETTQLIASFLAEAAIPNEIVPTGRGLVAGHLGGSGHCVAMRGDMDGLRIQDLKQVPYASTRPGRMHACGHDAHSAMVLGAALALAELAPFLPWPCPWRAIFQPAEETAEGAEEMIAAGAIDGARAIVGVHVDPETPVGEIALRVGPLTANCQELTVTIHGAGGHGAKPHQCIDPLAAAAQFINDAYRLLPRQSDAREPVVVTFGTIAAGANPNVIPESVRLGGTIRTLNRDSAEATRDKLERIANGIREMTGARIEIHTRQGTDAVINDPEVTAIVAEAAGLVVGSGRTRAIPLPSMGGEDFAAYLKAVPGCMFRLGVVSDALVNEFLHSPRFDIDERALTIGAKILAHSVVLLSRPAEEFSP